MPPAVAGYYAVLAVLLFKISSASGGYLLCNPLLENKLIFIKKNLKNSDQIYTYLLKLENEVKQAYRG